MKNVPRWSEFTALFGGTFDPPHLGHQAAVHGLFENPGVKRVLILPSPTPPHKFQVSASEDRIEMTRRCFAPELFQGEGYGPGKKIGGEVSIDLRELAIQKDEPPTRPSFTFDTLNEIRREIPHLAFVIGTDQLEQLHTWYRFPELLNLCHWIVLMRKPQGDRIAHRILAEWQASGLTKNTYIKLVETQAPEISSTQIRETIARTGMPPENSLPEGVIAYLKLRSIYGTGRPSQ